VTDRGLQRLFSAAPVVAALRKVQQRNSADRGCCATNVLHSVRRAPNSAASLRDVRGTTVAMPPVSLGVGGARREHDEGRKPESKIGRVSCRGSSKGLES
jgi:hypothetical protein